MNKFIGIGRITADPMVKYNAQTGKAIARYTLALNKAYARNGESTADFVPCVCFGKNAEFVDKHLKKGVKIAVEGSITTNNYTNKDGQKVFSVEVLVNSHEFVESKSASQQYQQSQQTQQQYGGYQQNPTPQSYQPQNTAPAQNYQQDSLDGFMSIPDGISSDELPFA